VSEARPKLAADMTLEEVLAEQAAKTAHETARRAAAEARGPDWGPTQLAVFALALASGIDDVPTAGQTLIRKHRVTPTGFVRNDRLIAMIEQLHEWKEQDR